MKLRENIPLQAKLITNLENSLKNSDYLILSVFLPTTLPNNFHNQKTTCSMISQNAYNLYSNKILQ